MKVEILNNYMTDENTYIVFENNRGIVIDPGNDVEKIIERANSLNIRIEYIFITHCHYDHIEYMEKLREKLNIPLVSGDKASLNIGNPNINLSTYGLGYEICAKESDIILEDGETKNFCGMDVLCIYTPGHTDCGVCYIIGDSIFTGDTLFLRSIGRSDLPTGNHNILLNTIKEKLYSLDENLKVYSGHGNSSTIGYEKKFNFYVKG